MNQNELKQKIIDSFNKHVNITYFDRSGTKNHVNGYVTGFDYQSNCFDLSLFGAEKPIKINLRQVDSFELIRKTKK